MRHQEPIARFKKIIYSIGLINFIFTLHLAIPAYIDSSYLSLFASENFVGVVYMAAAGMTVLAFFLIYRVLKRYGDYATAIGLIALDAITMVGIIWGQSPVIIEISFVLNMAILALVGFTNDVFLETYTEVSHTGQVRGWFLALENSAWILSPLIAGILITDHVYTRVFIASLSLLVPVAYLVHKNLHRFADSPYESPSVGVTIREIAGFPDIWKLFMINIFLQTFYCWMVIYTPLYLLNVVGFDWSSIGIILTVMLVPFVLIQAPFGRIADRGWGEKRLMALGFIVMGATTIALSFIHSPSIIIWASALFATRIGAALAEVMIETYFFKKVKPRNSNILSLFRTTRQIPYFIAPIITAVGLMFTDSTGLFTILGVICFLPLFLIAFIHDTDRII